MRISLLTISLTVILYACHSNTKTTSNVQPGVPLEVVLRPIDAALNEDHKALIDTTRSRLPSGDRFFGAQFIDAENGWVFGSRSLFRTSDSANAWTRLPLALSEDARVNSVFFVDRERGWLASHVRLILEPDDSRNASTIMVTSDGGKSWSEQMTFPPLVEINQLKFFDANHGFAIGSRLVDGQPAYNEIFVAKTTDGGKNWIDISEALKRTDFASGIISGRGFDLQWLSNNENLLLTEGQILSTSDGGQTWKHVVTFKDERPLGMLSSTSYNKLVFDPQKRFSVVGGAMGDEGYYGDFVVRDDQNRWLSYELAKIPIFDAVLLSEREVLACGFEIYQPNSRVAARDVGILLYSSDSGKNWTPLYRSNATERFVQLARIGDREFYAVSDAGTVLRFTLNKQ
jgi:photosystem II stability/assembly factor-like uncharacterized protein